VNTGKTEETSRFFKETFEADTLPTIKEGDSEYGTPSQSDLENAKLWYGVKTEFLDAAELKEAYGKLGGKWAEATK